jgi:hypothetical protein
VLEFQRFTLPENVPAGQGVLRGIDPELVNEVWREMTRYAPERVAGEAQAFLAQQPHVAAFSHAVTRGNHETVQRAGLGLCFLLFKVLERSLGRPFPELAEARITDAYAATRAWLDGQETADPGTVVRAIDGAAHPSLVTHILATLYGGGGAGADYDDGVRATLALLLGTLTDALDLGPVEG